ncbi:MAG: Wzz/FepE/Etk N-terminal domain-containing protein [Marinilabiliales bacterium]|nr:Wzz/FepE/Etk N-terminal domain-containing protein [Marinilabiliales bacterium]
MEKENINANASTFANDEIDLLAYVRKIWNSKKVVVRSVLIFMVIGIAIALLSPKEYTATSTIVPQLGDSNSKLGGLSGLAALAGLNLDFGQQNSADLSPIVYPQIVSSVPFQLELMDTPLNFQDFNEPATLFDYLTKLQKPSVLGTIKKYTVGLPGMLLRSLRGKPSPNASSSSNPLQPINLTEEQVAVQQLLDLMVSLDVKPKEGYLSITVNLNEPVATAQLALKAQSLLQKYIINFKTQKAQANLDFIESSYLKAKKEFEQAQIKLAIANDRSKGFTSGLAQVETDRLQSQYTITFGVYQELAKQYELAKIQVKKETPVFTVVEPPIVPWERTKPNRVLIVITWIFLGGLVGIGTIFGKEYLQSIKKKWKDDAKSA